MKRVMMDTDVLSLWLREDPTVIQNAHRYLGSHEELNLSIITYYEIRNGLLYKDARKQMDKFRSFVDLNRVLPLTMGATQKAAAIYATLKSTGQPIGHTDCLIAGIALASNMRLATNNNTHFSRIEELEIVDWAG